MQTQLNYSLSWLNAISGIENKYVQANLLNQQLLNAPVPQQEKIDVRNHTPRWLEKNGPIEPMIALWILRLLVPLELHKKFIYRNYFINDELAQIFGLNQILSPDKDDVNRPIVDYGFLSQYDLLDEEDSLSPLIRKKVFKHLNRCYKQTERRAAEISLPQPLANNIELLQKQLGMSDVEAKILAFVVLLNTHRLLDSVCNLLGQELNYVMTYHILAVTLNVPEEEIRNAFSNNSVLLKSTLVILDRQFKTGLVGKFDLLSLRFIDRLATESGSPVEWLKDIIIPSKPAELSLTDYPHIKESLDILLPYLQQVKLNKKLGVNVFLYGVPGTGKTQLIRLLAQQLDMPLYEITSEDKVGNPIEGALRLRAYRIAQAFFQNSQTLLLFDEVEDVFNDGSHFEPNNTAQSRKAWMNRLLEGNHLPTFWLGNSIHSVDPAFIRRFDWVQDVPIPPRTQRERIIREHCGMVLSDQSIQRLSACDELAPAVVTRAAKVVGELTGQVTPGLLSSALQQIMNNTLQAQGHKGLKKSNRLELPEYYDVGLINCDADLKLIADGIQRNENARICLFGPPGTGKSAYAYWLVEHLKKPLHVKRGADIFDMMVGGTEKNIARIFDEAEKDNAVLLLDEVDSFLQERSQSQHSWEITAVNEMLTRMESFDGILIATTNRLEGIDTAALRRFDLKVKFDALKPIQAWELLQRYCQSLGIDANSEHAQTNIQRLEGLTPGDFAVLARQHRFRPFTSISDVLNALQAECLLKTPYQRQPIGFT